MTRLSVFMAVLISASPASAEVLFSDGAWQLELVTYDDGSLGCSTTTTNDDGTTFFFESWPDGTAAVSVLDPDWTFSDEEEPVSFGLRVNGGDVWVAEGVKVQDMVESYIDFSNGSFDILMETLTNGTSMEILSAKGTPITHFTLNGAAATLEKHFDCEKRFPPK